MMENIKKELENHGLITEIDYDVIYASNNWLFFKVWKNRMIASTRAGFDRWANSIGFEKDFENSDELINYLKNNWSDILEELIKYLTLSYDELYDQWNEVKDLP